MKKYKVTVNSNGTEVWYQNEEIHREDGPAITNSDGDKFWYKHGKFHREDGPAVIYGNGNQIWYRHGKLHREGGPAMVYANGDKVWYLNGSKFTEEEFLRRTGKSCNLIMNQEEYKILVDSLKLALSLIKLHKKSCQ